MNSRFSKDKLYTLLVPLIAFLGSLLVGAVIFFIMGKNPLTAYHSLLQGSGFLSKAKYGGGQSALTDFATFVNAWTPLLLASLAVAVALRSGLFNIGVAGQMLLAGFLATITVGYAELHWALAKPLVLLVGALSGAALGGVIGLLKYRFNINEVVSSIMFNYIVQYIVGFFITLYYVNPISRQSNPVSKSARWTLIDVNLADLKIDIPLSIVLALMIAVTLQFLLTKTKLGFEIKAIGLGKRAAKHTGMPIAKNIIAAMMMSGALAGIAGVMYYLGYYGSIQPRTLSPVGFDSIAVALLGGLHPLGIILSSFVISIFSSGSTYMRSVTGVEAEINSVIIGVILLFSACGAYIHEKLRAHRGGKHEYRDK